jgi:hypothetical protein
MPAATGSIAFLGAARFQGNWNAATNAATGSALDGAKFTATSIGNIEGLFETGSSIGGGYGAGGVGLTASAGDYWQVTAAGGFNVDGTAAWAKNDWCIYSGSASGTGTWRKLAFTDTIASIIIGDMSAAANFNLTGSANGQVLFISGTTDPSAAHSGSQDFTFDYNTSQLLLTGNLLIADDKKIYFGAGNDASIEYDENGTNELRFAGAAVTFEQGVTFDGDVALGATSDDLISFLGKVTSNVEPRADNTYDLGSASLQWKDIYVHGIGYIDQLGTDGDPVTAYISGGEIDNTIIGSETAALATFTTVMVSASIVPDESGGADLGTTSLEWGNIYIADDKKIYFGNGSDASVEYDEDGTDQLRFAGAAAVFEQTVFFSDDVVIADDKKLYFGPSNDATIEYDEDGTDELRFGGTKPVTFENDVSFDSDVTLGNAITDATTVSSQLTASHGMLIPDDKKIYFGTGHDAHIEYDENLSDYLIISGAVDGLALSGTIIGIDGKLQLSDASALPASNGGLTAVGGTLVVSGSAIADGTIAVASDEVVFLDADGSLKRETITDLATAMAGTGLNASAGQIGLHFAEIGGVTPVASTDSIMILDNGSLTKRVTVTTMGSYLAVSNGGLANTSGQLAISGSNIADGTVAVANDQIVFLDSDGSLKRETIADFTSGIAGTGLDASSGQLTVDLSEVIASDGANRVLTSDADGTATANTRLTFDGIDLFITGAIKVADDRILHFGAENNTSIYYDEAGQDMLVISGSTFGTTLSGSLVRVVDKLAIGTDTNAAKTSGILVVQAAAADTTNGLIATFKSDDSDYCRVNIDNSTANGDTQFTFMSNGSSKWSVGNMGSNETFHIKSGFGDFADADRFVINASDGMSLNTIVTASTALLVPDDKKLYLGTGHDAHIEYNENGDDLLIISGSTAGMALSGSTVTVVGGDTILEAAGKPVARAVGPARGSTTNISNAFSFVKPVIKVTADTQLYAGDSGALIMFNDAAATITLPDSGDAANLGVWYSFAVSAAAAGTKKIVVTDTTNERFAGIIKMFDTDTSNAISFQAAAGAANVSITFNGSTTGVMGSALTIVATAADEWTVVESDVLHTGDVANPFGTS